MLLAVVEDAVLDFEVDFEPLRCGEHFITVLAGEVAVGAVLVFHPGRGPVTAELLVLGAVGRGGQVRTALVSGKEQKKINSCKNGVILDKLVSTMG